MWSKRARALGGLLVLAVVAAMLPAGVEAEPASAPTSPAAGRLDAGRHHTCALLAGGGGVRCWGFSGDGQLGYGNRDTIGDDETPGAAGPVDLGAGRTAVAISAGDFHTCALLDDRTVRCWGLNANGQLGYPGSGSVGDDETPGAAGPVDLGAGRAAVAISAGDFHTCALLDDRTVRCWGFGANGRLGYGNRDTIGDDETPGSVGPVKLGPGRRAVAISAGGMHTCALLDDGSVRCWGDGGNGQLGYGNRSTIGDRQTPDLFGPVNLGPGRRAVAISAGASHTCAVLDDGDVRCWGYGGDGELGYGNPRSVGGDETPGVVGPVDLGPGRRAIAISAGQNHTCALLDDDSVRCWGFGGNGRLGYGNVSNIGDNETPGSVGPVDLGLGRGAIAISAGARHTCARLDDGNLRCWGFGGSGRLGYCNESSVGDDETPGSVGPVDLRTPGVVCAGSSGGDTGPAPDPGGNQSGGGVPVAPAPDSTAARPTRALGSVTRLRARAVSRTKIKLSFRAAAANGRPARTYVVKQSRRPIRSKRDFRRAQTLCKGRCRFAVPGLGAKIILTVTDLRPRTTYYYAVAARDNASSRLGPRSKTVKAKTRR